LQLRSLGLVFIWPFQKNKGMVGEFKLHVHHVTSREKGTGYFFELFVTND